jgi:hypothetical protein
MPMLMTGGALRLAEQSGSRLVVPVIVIGVAAG